MQQGTWCSQRLHLLRRTAFLLGVAGSLSGISQENAVLVRLQPDTLQWQAWITVPHLWTLAALPPSPPAWMVELQCLTDTLRFGPVQGTVESSPPLELLLCLDRSATATLPISAVRTVLKTLAHYLRPEDRLVIIQYRYRADAIHAFAGWQAVDAIDTMLILPALGVAAPLHILQAALEYCHQRPSSRLRALLLLTESADNASFLVSAEEVIERARQQRLPLSILHVGMTSERALWKALSSRTGGAYLWSPLAAPDILTRQLSWLVRGLQVHYCLHFPAPPPCPGLQLSFSSEQLGTSLQYRLGDSLPQQGASSRMLCVFEPGDTAIGPETEPLLKDLAQWLRAHPQEVIELVGHCALNEAETRALQRVQALRRRLLRLGVAPRQLRLRSEGNRRPLVYFEQTPQHQRLNCRAELRWLRPEALPYELLAGVVSTEAQALRELELWEARGYAAYYEPILQHGEPAFRIKLWGFASEADAERARRHIQRRYGLAVQRW